MVSRIWRICSPLLPARSIPSIISRVIMKKEKCKEQLESLGHCHSLRLLFCQEFQLISNPLVKCLYCPHSCRQCIPTQSNDQESDSETNFVHCREWGKDCGEFGLEVENVSVDFGTVNFGVIPTHTVRGLFSAEFIERFQQFFIAAHFIFLNEVLDALIILNPENGVPGLIIGPTVVGTVGQVGLVSGGGHLVRFV
jgi:hypothetical protein